MNKQDPLQEEKSFFADVTYKKLISMTRSEDTSLNYYGMELEKQNATEDDFKQFAWLFAESFIVTWFKLKKKNKSPSEEQTNRLIIKCLENAWKEYNEKRR